MFFGVFILVIFTRDLAPHSKYQLEIFYFPLNENEGLLVFFFWFYPLDIPKFCDKCPPFLISPPFLLLVVVMPTCAVPVAKDPAFSVGAPPLDDILIDLVFPNLDVFGLSCCGSTSGILNSYLWLCCDFYLYVVKY